VHPGLPSEPAGAAEAPPSVAFATALVDALADAGVHDACVSPGSRSTPLVLALHAEARIALHVHLDERSAGFFGLGLARASRRPVALVCTSGTAAANLLPAVVEAGLTRVPLVVLTADRPPELRDRGAPQTIDQVHLFGRHARWFAEAPVPDGSAGLRRVAAALGARAAAVAAGSPPGPVHLNLPFREPLAPAAPLVPRPAAPLVPRPAAPLVPRPAARATAFREWRAAVRPAPEAVARLAEAVARHERGVVVCGPLDDPDAADAITALARAAAWPVLADPTAQLRRGAHVVPDAPLVAHGDLLLGDAGFAGRHTPQVVLRFGAPPTSKAVGRWVEAAAPEAVFCVDPDDGFRDPDHVATDFVRSDPAPLCDALVRAAGRPARRAGSPWLDAFRTAEAAAARAVARTVDGDPTLLAAAAVRTLGACLPEGVLLYVANSMAVRDLDAFLPAAAGPARVLANRGANGIDGLVSSALGAAASGAPTVLWTGDLGLLHDASGLLTASRAGHPLAIVVLDDDGGGIFSHLPVAALGEAVGFERLFRTPHGRDLLRLCRGLELEAVEVRTRDHLRAALKDALARPGASLVRVPIDAQRNLEQHRRVRRAVAGALGEALP